MLNQVVHNLTHRRFKDTPRASVYQLGSAVANSFFDPRNIGNFEAGEIAPEGNYLTHYPVNAGSNTAGFSIMDDEGDDKRSYYPSQVYSGKNALVKGGGVGPSSGSASDYVYFNPAYEALLNPKSNKTMSEIAQPHFLPRNTLVESEVAGRGTNAPSSASAVDYAMNNPYAFKSNFNGSGALGAASSGSASDYYDSNPNRVPAMQSETRHYTEFMEGGAVDWTKYLGYIRKGAETIAPHLPTILEHAPRVIQTVNSVRDAVKDAKKEKGTLNKLGAVAKHVPRIYEGVKSSLDTIQELRGVLRNNRRNNQRAPAYRDTRVPPAYRDTRVPPAYRDTRVPPAYRERPSSAYEEIDTLPAYRERGALPSYEDIESPPDYEERGAPPAYKERKQYKFIKQPKEVKKSAQKKSAQNKQYKFMKRADYERENVAPAYRDTRMAPAYRDTRVPPAYVESEAPEYYEGEYDELPVSSREPTSSRDENIVMRVNEVAKKKAGRPRKEKVEKPKGKVGRPKKEKVVKPKGKVGRPSKAMRTMQIDV